jgi:hypothetical protein
MLSSDPQLDRLHATRPRWARMAGCPFCLARADEFHISVTYCTDRDGHLKSFMGECDECGAMGPTAPTPEAAIRQWNARGASVDTHPEGGDAQQAPSLMGSAVAVEDGQTP